MNTISRLRPYGEKIEHWTDLHHPMWLDYLRILLGVILVIKGLAYVINKDIVLQMIESSEYWVLHYAIAHYVIGGYIACGLAIAFGLFTRIAILFEIPAVLGSIIFLDMHKNLFELNSVIVYSILVLALCLFFLLYGPGKLSVDYYIQKHRDKDFDAS